MENLIEINDDIQQINLNVNEMNRLLSDETYREKRHKNHRQVIDLQRETTKLARKVCDILKESPPENASFHEKKLHHKLLGDFVKALTEFSAVQRVIIDFAQSNDCVDNGSDTRLIAEIDEMISVISLLLFNSIDNKSRFLTIITLTLVIGITIGGGIIFFRHLKK